MELNIAGEVTLLRRDVNLTLAGRLVYLAILAVLAGYILSGVRATDAERGKQAGRAASAIREALAQCYALEGGYPDDVRYLSHYGVIFDDERFYYYYERNGLNNYMPDVRVAAKP
ncbi:MAG: hypothetical protein FWC55_02290 [Firmicutes bacterium]|nr:hypothetical protein [Bacillota bacterium]